MKVQTMCLAAAACDPWRADWNLAGAVQDIRLVGTIGGELARSDRWPQWKAGSEFLPLRPAPGTR